MWASPLQSATSGSGRLPAPGPQKPTEVSKSAPKSSQCSLFPTAFSSSQLEQEGMSSRVPGVDFPVRASADDNTDAVEYDLHQNPSYTVEEMNGLN